MTRSPTYDIHFEALPAGDVTELNQYPEQTIPYHVPTDTRTYSLDYATENLQDAHRRLEDKTDEETTARILSFDHLAAPFYGIYTANTHTNYGSTNLDHISNNNTRTIVDTYTTIFESVMDHSNSNWHKPINIVRAGQTIDNTQWKQPVTDVAGELLSSLILAHPLPNTNHRSTIAFTTLYLSTIDTDFSLPEALSTYPKFEDWIDSFIVDSKRTLTTRRNTGLFKWLNDQGITTVVRKGNVLISLDNYDFSQNNLYSTLSDRHQSLATELITDLLLETDDHELLDTTDPGKQVFADRVDVTSTETTQAVSRAVADFRD